MRSPTGLILLCGGARSGKSSYAERLGRRFDAASADARAGVSYLATAPIVDDDMAERVGRHVAGRPDHWRTIEEQVDLLGALTRAGNDFVIIDCLTLWVSNLMWRDRSDEQIDQLARVTAAAAADRAAPTVVVTNEVGLGVHPEHELGRRYRDVLGRTNQAWAAAADRSLLLVAGRALLLNDPDDLT